MNNSQKGFVGLLIIVILVILVVATIFVYKNEKQPSPTAPSDPAQVDPTLGAKSTPGTATTTATSTAVTRLGIPATPVNIQKAHNALGLNLMKSLAKSDTNKNIFISPSSIALALSMVYNGANSTTKTAMQQTLHLQGLDISTINKESLGLMSALQNPGSGIELTVANSIWAKKGFEFNPNFIGTIESYYKAQSSTIDFADPASVTAINSWASKNTKGKIPTIIDKIPADMVMYLINAVYFKGSWTLAFEKKLTEDRLFYSAGNKTKNVPMMHKSGSLPYFENAEVQSVKLTYGKDAKVSMYVFLPKDLNSFVSGLTPTKWAEYMRSYQNKPGDLFLPRFKLEYEKQLKDSLSGLGMSVAFSDKADLSGIGGNLKISEVKHKTYVDVNEEGTEAAAVTSVGVSVTSVQIPDDPFMMEVNKPFFFGIVDDVTGEILFTGAISSL
jgi:serpin B